ncbi:hypothetical protein MNBD_GAMMA17-86 [hydrothermal vent metagenome]|uniref:Uncharacterized protein n=1 Tax=hydrothermal vent metagenome TaxID=652676 RepID=A0A3B0ZM40_9ZZZZ
MIDYKIGLLLFFDALFKRDGLSILVRGDVVG